MSGTSRSPLDPLTPPKLEQRLARPAQLCKSSAITDGDSTTAKIIRACAGGQKSDNDPSHGGGSATEIRSRRTRRTVGGLLVLMSLAVLCYHGVTTSRGATSANNASGKGVTGDASSEASSSSSSSSSALRQSRRARRDLVLDDHLADLTEPLLPNDGGTRTDLPVYWHVAKSGGTTMKELVGACYGLTLASEIGGNLVGQGDKELRVVEARGKINNEYMGRHINVDVTTEGGIQRAASLHLAQSGLADVLVSPMLHDVAANILSRSHRGRMFALFRHPIDRLVSLFYYLQAATHEPTYDPRLANMTLSEYAASGLVESNIMVRSLSNKMEGPLSADDLEEAKRTLRTKCLVGLLDEMETSLARFRHFFHWDGPDGNYGPMAERCQEQLLARGGSNRVEHPILVDRNSRDYDNFARKNVLDLILYEYARQLFVEQGALLSALESNSNAPASVEVKRHLDASATTATNTDAANAAE